MVQKEVLAAFFTTDYDRDSAEYVMLEVLNNAWEHGNGKDESKMIEIEWWINCSHLTISVADEGAGFTPAIPAEAPPITQPRGRGLFSIHEIVSSLTFSEQGNQVTLTFRK